MIDKFLKNNGVNKEMYSKALNDIETLKEQIREQERDFKKINKKLEYYNSIKRDYEFLQEDIQEKEKFYQRRLANFQNEITKLNDKIACFKLETNNLHKENEQLKSENNAFKSMYNPKLKPKAKKVDKNLVIRVKEMSKDHSYREIQKIVNLGVTTISRIINGKYDNLLK